MTHAAAVAEAIAILKRKPTGRKERLEAVARLARYGAFSNAQISRITGADARDVAPLTGKTDHSGGKLEPEALVLIGDIIKRHQAGEIDNTLFVRTVDAGTSSVVIGRLTGIPPRSVRRYIARGRDAA